MNVKGNAWLARSEAMEKRFGAARWAAFLKTHAAKFPFVASQVLPITKIPVNDFLALHDALVAEFYNGDTKAYWAFGEASGEWALTHQLRGLFAPKEARRFLQFSPTVYGGYFDAGEMVVESGPTSVDLVVRGLVSRHVYFEYSIMGFAVGGLRVLEVPVTPQGLSGFSKNDAEIRYRFEVA